jgi:phage gpG-like protein
MSLVGGFDSLHEKVEHLRAMARGDAARKVVDAMKDEALHLAEEGWDRRESPEGQAWKPGLNGAGGLKLSGRLRAGLVAEDRELGFALVDRAMNDKGAFYGGTHQYGRTIRPGNWQSRKEYRALHGHAEKGRYLRWFSGGRWHRSEKVRIPARPVLPKKRTIPDRWDEQLQKAAAGALEKGFGK